MHHLLEEARERFTDLHDFGPAPLLMVDSNAIIRQLNLPAVRMFGGERSQMLGMSLLSLVVPVERKLVRQHLLKCRSQRASAEGLSIEVTLALSEGRQLPVKLISRRTADNRGACWTAIIDLTDRKRLMAQQRQQREAQREARKASEAKDLFMSMLSHELRSPLAALALVVNRLERGELAPRDQQEVASVIRRNAAAQTRLVDDLLDVVSVARGKVRLELGPVDLHEIVAEAVQTFSEEQAAKRMMVVLDLRAERHHVMGDDVRLRQVFWNLVKNAVKYTPAGGKVTVRSWNSERGVVVEVVDTGIGLDPKSIDRLFAPFEQVAPSGRNSCAGVGLGLSIVKSFVELHQGRVTASSAGLGKGASFLVELATITAPARKQAGTPRPLSVTPTPQPVPTTRSVSVTPPPLSVTPPPTIAVVEASLPWVAPPKGPRILLVEDNPDIAEPLGQTLTSAGYQVDIANSFRAALSADRRGVDLVLSDLELPDGSGIELVRRLRERRPVVAIALSGYASPRHVQACREAGFVAHFRKPLDLPALMTAIEAATRRAGPKRVRVNPGTQRRGGSDDGLRSGEA